MPQTRTNENSFLHILFSLLLFRKLKAYWHSSMLGLTTWTPQWTVATLLLQSELQRSGVRQNEIQLDKSVVKMGLPSCPTALVWAPLQNSHPLKSTAVSSLCIIFFLNSSVLVLDLLSLTTNALLSGPLQLIPKVEECAQKSTETKQTGKTKIRENPKLKNHHLSS